MTDNIERISSYNFVGAKVTVCRKYITGHSNIHLWLTDEEYLRTGTRKLNAEFFGAEVWPEIKCADVVSAEIQRLRFASDGTSLTAVLRLADGRQTELSLSYQRIQCTEYEYDGMSYDNIYDDLTDNNRRYEYMFSEQYKQDEEELDPGRGYRLLRTDYADSANIGGTVSLLESYSATLTKDGERIFSYRVYADATPNIADKVIMHSNGKEYFLFREGLYGLSVLDISSGKTYRYIPRGYEHDRDYPCGESFIITDIHYDPATDLIAFGGCFWACPYDVVVGDFSQPMSYDPRYVNIHRMIDPDYEEINNIDFAGWGRGELDCTGDGSAFSLSVDALRDALRSGKYMS